MKFSMETYTTNQRIVGLKSRDKAKTFIYALIYGAGDQKIGSIVEEMTMEKNLSIAFRWSTFI